jgi:septal ring factor EnvC (AmiA/AmiB activator)
MTAGELQAEIERLNGLLSEADELVSELQTQVATLELEKTVLEKELIAVKDTKNAMSGNAGSCWWCGKKE